jgi:DNA processing protein
MSNLGIDDAVYMASLVDGLMPTAKLLHRLLSVCRTPQTLWRQWGPRLLNDVLPAPTAKKWQAKSVDWQTESHLEATRQKLISTHTHMVLWADLPTPLKAIADPPACLFARGDISLLHACRSLAIVGTRQATDYSRLVIPQILKGLAQHQPVIVSGMAAGVDGMAHQAALDLDLPTIAVMGTGLNTIYPSHHTAMARRIADSGGLLLSEYPLGFQGDRYTFPARNRIIAGLSQGVWVTECPVRSGAMITARVALDSGRDVLALPGNIREPNAEGPNQLIAQGATPVLCSDTIIYTLGWVEPVTVKIQKTAMQLPLLQAKTVNVKPTTKKNGTIASVSVQTAMSDVSSLPADVQTVWAQIPAIPTPIDHLVTKLPAGANIQVALTTLELAGLITLLPGQQVARS